jgi:hypothetical protein
VRIAAIKGCLIRTRFGWREVRKGKNRKGAAEEKNGSGGAGRGNFRCALAQWRSAAIERIQNNCERLFVISEFKHRCWQSGTIFWQGVK